MLYNTKLRFTCEWSSVVFFLVSAGVASKWLLWPKKQRKDWWLQTMKLETETELRSKNTPHLLIIAIGATKDNKMKIFGVIALGKGFEYSSPQGYTHLQTAKTWLLQSWLIKSNVGAHTYQTLTLLFLFSHSLTQVRLCIYSFNVVPGRSRGGCMRCQQSHSLQLAVKVLYGFVAFLIITVAVLASLGELRLTL